MCSILLVIKGSDEGIRMGGELLNKQRFEKEGEGYLEFSCNRKDGHPKIGEHWFDGGDYRIAWEVPEDATWMA